MKRNIKNIVIILLILAMSGTIYITMNYVKKQNNSNNPQQNMNDEMPLDIQNNMNDNFDEQTSNNANSDMEEASEKPDGNSDEQMSKPPEKPDGEDNNAPSENIENDNMPSDNGQQMNNQPSLSYIYYIIFGIENLILASLIMYLIMSKFNKKTIKETLTNKDKIIIIILSTIILTSILTFLDIIITNNIMINKLDNNQQGMDYSNDLVTYSSSNEIKENKTLSNEEYTSSKEDENALLVSGNIDVTLSNINVNKTGDSDGGDNTSFYGINSAIIAKDGANLTLKNITVSTDATGANGVFSYGGSATTNNSSNDGTTIIISDSKITTTKDNSGGIMTTGGGTTNASNLTINTAGISSAAIRTDRGGGTVNVDGGTYTTTNQGSPTIYSTASITVNNAKLIAKVSEGIVIEGKNSVSINNCELTDSNTKLNGQSTTYKNIFLYQSMSGDAADGTAEFTAKNSTITTNNGDTLYVTNTKASINLENNIIKNNDSTGNFLRVQKDSWGNDGSNGGDVTLNLTNQNVTGNIVIDSISTLSMNMKTNSYYEGIINSDNTAKSINLILDKTSKIKLTGNSYITSLENSDTSNNNIDYNGYKLYVNGTSIN